MFISCLLYSFHSKATEQLVEHVALSYFFLKILSAFNAVETNNDTDIFPASLTLSHDSFLMSVVRTLHLTGVTKMSLFCYPLSTQVHTKEAGFYCGNPVYRII